MIQGNKQGIRDSLLERLEAIEKQHYEAALFLPEELAQELADLTGRIGREIAVNIARDGMVMSVCIGDASTVQFPDVRLKRRKNRLNGVRCIHTHPESSALLSELDIHTLLKSKLDAMCAIGVRDGKVWDVQVGVVDGENPDRCCLFGPYPCKRLPLPAMMGIIHTTDQQLLQLPDEEPAGDKAERALLIGIQTCAVSEELDELGQLAKTAGAEVVATHAQRRSNPDAASYIGQGTLRELSHICMMQEVSLCIADDELSAVQIRNLEAALGVRIIDRTALILDIFASRAKSREGRMQVELAQLKYRLPRLLGRGTQLSRLGGGIGTRGPGEKKLEVDRRRIRRRIFELEKEIDRMQAQRGMQRRHRQRTGMATVALVGYTNAGKTTLFNALTEDEQWVQDALFATLDSVTRKMQLPDGETVLLSDTVGFIQKLPHDLVDAFRSTLEETVHADLLLHVIDATSATREQQREVVEEVLRQLKVAGIPVLNVYNKCDGVHDELYLGGGNVEISALHGQGLDALREAIAQKLAGDVRTLSLTIPYDKLQAQNFLHNNAKVLAEEYGESGIEMQFKAPLPIIRKAASMLRNASEAVE